MTTPPLAAIKAVTPDGKWTPETLQFLLSLYDTIAEMQAQIADLEDRVTALEP